MRILYIHQYFRTPYEGGAIRSWYIATALNLAGHHVEMLTAHNKNVYEIGNIDGIRVHYLPVKYDSSFGFLRRLWSFIWFAYKAYYYSIRLGKFDKAYITSTPLTVGLIALRLKRKHDLPYIFEVRDLWPEAPIEAGIIRSSILKNFSRKLELKIYSQSSGIVALSPGIKKSLENKNTGRPIYLCTNISDCGFFEKSNSPEAELMEKYGTEKKFVIGYFGAIGKLNALEYLLNFAGYCQTRNSNIGFMIIGNGSEKKNLQKSAREMQLKNIVFIEHLDKFELRRHLRLIHAAYISFASLKVLESNSPNKFFDAMASGKLILLNFNGWIREFVELYECGFYADPNDHEKTYKNLETFMNDNDLLNKSQQNSRRLAEGKFERNILTADLVRFIES